MPEEFGIRPVGDRALMVELENRIDSEINRKARAMAMFLEGAGWPGVREVLPAYRSVLVVYDPLEVEFERLREGARQLLKKAESIEAPPGRLFRLPTIYGGPDGPDLPEVARRAGLPPEEVVGLFSETTFLVYFIGFLCGMPYLGGLPEELHLPRMDTPRTSVPAGSVGLAGAQAVVLPTDQPSGFHYIGRTFVRLYDPEASPPAPFRSGDEIQFVAVPAGEAARSRSRPAGDFL